MTKFDELMDIITHNKNKNKGKGKKPIPSSPLSQIEDDDEDIEIEVSGSESKSTKGPLLAAANEETEPDIIDQLYRSNRNRVPRGEGASAWDSDY